MIQLHNKQKRWFKPFWVTGIAITLAGLPVGVRAQNQGAVQNPNSPAAGGGVSAGANVSANASVNISEDESRNLGQFLDSHPEIVRQLQSNPALANDPDYLRANPDLRDYLQQHPQLQTALRDDASGIMRQQQQFETQNNGAARQNGNYDRGQAQANTNTDRDNADRDAEMNRRDEESARIDQFLSDHPNIDKDLKSKPQNVNDSNYLKKHGELANFLHDNPDVRDECQRNPAFFEDRNLRAQMIRTDFNNTADRDNGLRSDALPNDRVEVANFDRFLDSHREIAEQLRRDPSLADNQKFVQNHPALQTYLQQNPAIRDQLGRDPSFFMRQEDNFGRLDSRDRDRFASFRQFMDQHPRIRGDVWKNHALVKNDDYLHRNPELGDYLKDHPDVRDAWSANPDSFVKGAQQFNANGTPGTNIPSGTNDMNRSGDMNHGATGGTASPSHTTTTGTGTTGTGSSSSPSPNASAPATLPKTRQ
jgi:hypothetical protein